MTRAEIVERLARGLYEREKVRDRTSHEKQAEWEDLNFGRKATRLHYADELFEILFGGFGFTWEMVDALKSCVEALRHAEPAARSPDADPAGREASSPAEEVELRDRELREAEQAIGIIETLLPPRVSHGPPPSPPRRS